MHEVDLLALFHHRAVPAEPNGSPLALLLLHGTGGDEDDLLPLGPISRRARHLLAARPRARRRRAAVLPAHRGGVFDEEDLRHRTDELARFVRAARTRHGIEARPLVAAGFSNGANIAGSLLLLEPDALDGAILLRGMTPLTPATPPRLAGKRVFLGAGRADPLVRPYESERWAETLRGAGADVTLHWSDTGHALSQGDVDAAREWLRERFPLSPARPGGRS